MSSRLPDAPSPAVVLGLGQNGLASVRALGRSGIPVIGVDDDLRRPGAHSRYCRGVHCPGFREGGAALLAFLLDLGARLPAPAFLLPSGDLSLRLLSRHREALAPFYRFVLPAADVVDLVLDKRAFYAFAAARGFAVPATRAATAGTVRAIADEVRYPAILKPAMRDVAWREGHGVKLYEVRSPDELCARYHELATAAPEILVQELIPGPDTQLVFSLTYVDAAGTSRAMFTGRKLRQYRPRFGTSSMARSEWNPAVAETTLALLRALDYRGYGSVEFKQDARDGQLRVIEVTARTWYPHGLATRCGINLPYLAYADAFGLAIPSSPRFDERVTWIDEERDVRSAMESIRAGDLTVSAWLRSYRGRRTYALAAADDPGPFLALARQTLAAGVRRLCGWRSPRPASARRVTGGLPS